MSMCCVDRAVALRFVGEPVEIEVVSIRQTGLIDDGLVEECFLYAFGNVCKRSIPNSKSDPAVIRKACVVAGFARALCEFWTALGNLDDIGGKLARLVVICKLEARAE